MIRFINCSREFILATYSDSISIFSFEWQLIKTFGSKGTGPGQFMSIEGATTNSRQEIIVADRYCDRIQIFTRDGNFLYSFPMCCSMCGFGICVDQEDNILVADMLNDSIHIFTPSGTLIQTIRVWRPFTISISRGCIIVKSLSQKIHILSN